MLAFQMAFVIGPGSVCAAPARSCPVWLIVTPKSFSADENLAVKVKRMSEKPKRG